MRFIFNIRRDTGDKSCAYDLDGYDDRGDDEIAVDGRTREEAARASVFVVGIWVSIVVQFILLCLDFYVVLANFFIANDSQCQSPKAAGVGRDLGCVIDGRQYLVEGGSTYGVDRCYG